MAPTYKLAYFNVRALGEPMRLIFAYKGIPFEDIRMEKDAWPEQKSNFPWGTLPVLEVDGKVLGQSRAIARYLGKIFDIAGDNDFESAKCDEVIEAMTDLGNAGKESFIETDEAKKKLLTEKLMNETFPKFFGKFNEFIEKNGGFLVGKRISYADIFVASFLQLYNENVGAASGKDLFENYPGIAAHQKTVFGLPGIKKWVESRPKTQW